MSIRQPAVAGYFYPNDPLILKKTIQDLLNQAPVHTPAPKAILVPHAGYIYSGSVAASAYASLHNKKDSITKVVLLGPAHRLYFQGIAYDPVEKFATPLGEIEQDKELLSQITDLPYVYSLPQAHQNEHCLEIQLPFCQMIFSKFKILPLVVGETNPMEVAQLIGRIWGDDDTLIIISSDLSHYLPYHIAQREDKNTCIFIDTLDGESILHNAACGYFPLRGFLYFARQNHLYSRLLDLRNSGDTAGDKERVVGYAAYHFYQKLSFADHCGDELKYLAKETIRLQTEENKTLAIDYKDYHQLLRIRIPTFITIKKNGILRGCMGSLIAKEQLAENVIYNSMRAAIADPRFPRITASELKELSLTISLISPLSPLHFNDEEELKSQLRIGTDGLLLTYGPYQATFLPSVWIPLKRKMNL
ncbi:AmmeMemoRadiSam system protein B [Legionella norrlandica]|uniref:AmmeMemoRadiSam system protein B n=1 Tax=Legionella norrlandica TaxID=1498499 RepID=UPI000A901393|nr:AmmeMemoRadiSam system protein B [Legionella norrlandica]